MDEKEFKTMFDKCNQEAKNLHWFKIVFVGDCYVGKTSIIKSFCKAQFNPKVGKIRPTTIGARTEDRKKNTSKVKFGTIDRK